MTEPTTDPGNGGGNTSGYTPPATQQELNRIIGERVERVRAQYADYPTLQAEVARLRGVETGFETKLQAEADARAVAEAAVATLPEMVSSQLRTHLIARHGISDEDAALFLTANDPETLLKQVDRFVAHQTPPAAGNHVPHEGNNPPPVVNDEAAVVAALFNPGG